MLASPAADEDLAHLKDAGSHREYRDSGEMEPPLYRSDDFRMYCMKVLPCSKRYCHDWTSCPFSHPGEKARRRDPRTQPHTGIACPDMKKDGACIRGDTCPYAHNVFEYWLHPTRYRTQLCNDGTNCHRRICFFAHTLDELRVPSCKPFVSPEALAAATTAAAAEAARKAGLPGARTTPALQSAAAGGVLDASTLQALAQHLLTGAKGGPQATVTDAASARDLVSQLAQLQVSGRGGMPADRNQEQQMINLLSTLLRQAQAQNQQLAGKQAGDYIQRCRSPQSLLDQSVSLSTRGSSMGSSSQAAHDMPLHMPQQQLQQPYSASMPVGSLGDDQLLRAALRDQYPDLFRTQTSPEHAGMNGRNGSACMDSSSAPSSGAAEASAGMLLAQQSLLYAPAAARQERQAAPLSDRTPSWEDNNPAGDVHNLPRSGHGSLDQNQLQQQQQMGMHGLYGQQSLLGRPSMEGLTELQQQQLKHANLESLLALQQQQQQQFASGGRSTPAAQAANQAKQALLGGYTGGQQQQPSSRLPPVDYSYMQQGQQQGLFAAPGSGYTARMSTDSDRSGFTTNRMSMDRRVSLDQPVSFANRPTYEQRSTSFDYRYDPRVSFDQRSSMDYSMGRPSYDGSNAFTGMTTNKPFGGSSGDPLFGYNAAAPAFQPRQSGSYRPPADRAPGSGTRSTSSSPKQDRASSSGEELHSEDVAAAAGAASTEQK